MDDFALKTENEYVAMLDKLRHLVEAHPAQAVKILNCAAKKCLSGQHEKEKAGNRALYKWIYVCCRDFKIPVECHPVDRAIEYFDNTGNRHFYYPDFYLPTLNRLVEIKGDHFFEGKDPRNGLASRFSADPLGKAKAKSEAMSKHGVLVLPTARYLKYQRRAKRKYGNKWIVSCCIQKKQTEVSERIG